MVARLFLFLLILHMSKQLLKFLCLLFIMQILVHVETFSQLKNDFGYQGTIEIKVGETKTIWLIDKVQGMISLSTTYYPSGKWVLSNNFYNATMMSQSMQYCKVRGDKKGDNIKLTFSGNMILYDAMWEYTGYYYIKVVESDVKVTSISVSPSTTSLTVGGTQQLSATVSPSNATNKSVSWSSSNTSIATVSSSGLVTAKAAGSATITCKANDGSGKYATCSVKVEAIKVTEVRLNYTSVPMKIGDTKQLTATISPSNATDKSVTWSSSNTSVAKVSNTGLVTAVSEGTATITCKANDGSGKSATCSIPVSSALVAEINATNFPDEEFRKYLLSQSYGEDGKLTESEISKVTSISVSGKYSEPGSIKSLKGIEYFTALEYLFCSYNQLTKLDISMNTALTCLYCYNNQLTSLDVSKLTALKYLSCDNNQLTSLDVSKLTALTSLDCGNNQLTSLDVSKLTALTSLDCGNNQLTSLDVSKLTALTGLYCNNNQLTSLDVSKLTALKYLYCYNNQLTTLDISNLTALTYLYCGYNQLTTLDISKNTALTSLSCGNNLLTSLDVSRLTSLTSLYCSGNQLTSLDVSKLTALTTLSCGKNQLTALDVSRLTALTRLYCYTNQLTSLDVSNLTALTSLDCYINQLTSLDVSRLTALTYLSCGSNQLTSLDVSKLTALTYLSCGSNQLTSLDVSKLTVLQDLYCYNNQLSALDVSENKSLKLLSCYSNSIEGTSMDNLISSLPQNNTTDIHRFEVVGQYLSKEGNVCTVMQVAAVKAKGWFPCYYDSTTREYVEYKGSDKASTTKGDVNGDNQVNGTDLVALTNIILGKNAKTDAADVNGDGQVNGTDYVALVNIVLGRSQAPRRAATDAARLSIDPSFDIKAGETKEMVINLTNPNDEITLVQFDLSLPNGLSVKQTGGEYVYDIADRTTWRKHSLEANATGGIIRFLLASNSNATLSGTEGGIITITVTADKDFSGGDIKLENILMVSPDEKETKQDTYTYTIGQTSPTPSASAVLAIEPFNITTGGEAQMVIDLTNPNDEITLVQFDLRLPDGLSVKQTGGDYVYDITDRTTWRKHSLEANATGGIIRFLLASSSNATLSGTEGAIITITLKADNTYKGGTVKLENILLVTPDEKEIKPADLSYTIGSTDISSITTDAIDSNTPIYNLRGQRLAAPQKGINIIGGKKVIVK